MNLRWRALVALLLVSALPLRALAAVAMPCCPPAMEAQPSMDAAMNDASDGGATMPAHHDESHPTFDCCAIAMIALPIQPIVTSHYVPPQAMPLRAPSVAHFVTDAPERPPRASTSRV